MHQRLYQLDSGDMGVHALVPVQETFNIDDIANIQGTDSGVDLVLGTGQVDLNAEVVGIAVLAQGDIDVITGLAVLVLDSFNSHALEADLLILMSDQVVGAQQVGDVLSFSNVGVLALSKLEGGFRDLNFA